VIRQNIYNTIDRLFTKRQWRKDDIGKHVGTFDRSYILYSASEKTRRNAASGGLVTEVLIYCLENKLIEGALVCKAKIIHGKIRPEFFIATSRKDVLLAQGSKYVATHFSSEALPLIRKFRGKLAVVGLPCDLRNLDRQIQQDDVLSQKISLKVGLFCGHNSEVELIDRIAAQLEKEAGARLIDYKFGKGLWRGMIEAVFENGTITRKKTGFFKDYQNLFFFAQKKCFFCNDHFAYHADISAGDIWSYRLKDSPVKFSSIITRDAKSTELVCSMINRELIAGEEIQVEEILDGQSRGIRLHHNLSVKSKAGKAFGVKIPVPERSRENYKWHELLVAWIAFFNWRWSKGRRSHLIFKIPRPLLKIYLYIMKGFQSLP